MAAKQRRLRSSTVALGSVGVLAAALTSCGSDPDQRCVDRDSYDYIKGYKIVDSSECGSSSAMSTVDGAWYYDSEVSGSWADDGTFSRSEAVERGGFGDSDSGSSGG
jgi:hypothetical protein